MKSIKLKFSIGSKKMIGHTGDKELNRIEKKNHRGFSDCASD